MVENKRCNNCESAVLQNGALFCNMKLQDCPENGICNFTEKEMDAWCKRKIQESARQYNSLVTFMMLGSMITDYKPVFDKKGGA